MKSTEVDADGTVRCPVCRATSFTSKRTGKGKVALGLLATKRLRFDGCQTYLQPGRPPVLSWAEAKQARREANEKFAAEKADRKAAKVAAQESNRKAKEEKAAAKAELKN